MPNCLPVSLGVVPPSGRAPWRQPGHRGWRLRRRLPAGDGPDLGPRHRVVGDAGEQAAQFDRRGELAVLDEDGTDRGGNGLADQEHGPHDAAAQRAEQSTLS
jgi:hypothetical protein